eukprot:1479025-Prorocentrum_lima.AAC.1
MTSSLVGSEMCIRDSVLSLRQKRRGRAWLFESCWLRSTATTRPSPLPVSYTHLTLPTICSV